MNPRNDSQAGLHSSLAQQQRIQRLAELEKELADLHARLPAHSLSPAMMAELEELEDEIAQLRTQAENGSAPADT